MDATKPGRDQVIALDQRQLEVLRWHVERLKRENEKRARRFAGERGRDGGLRALVSCDADEMEWRWRIPLVLVPRQAIRRRRRAPRARLQGHAARDASHVPGSRAHRELAEIVTRAISGHSTPEMQRHYSTVSGDEMRAGLAKVIDIATGRERRAA